MTLFFIDQKTSNFKMDTTNVLKKRKTERKARSRKTELCKHFDKPGGCPYTDCKFAHGTDELQEGGSATIAAQRELIRQQVVSRKEEKFTENKSHGRAGVIERYYTQLFSCDTMDQTGEDQYVHMHSNRLCVVGVAPTHKLFQSSIEKVVFTDAILESNVSGKKKKGGVFLNAHSILGHVYTCDGKSYILRSCIRGRLLEVNKRLMQDPTLLENKPETDGYLVIVQPKHTEVMQIQASLLSHAEYKQFRAFSPVPTDDTSTPVEAAEVVHDRM